MFYLFLLILFLIIFYVVWDFLTRKYINPYCLYILFGHKGVGKSTLLQKLARYYRKRGYSVYCNIGDSPSPDITEIPIKEYLPRLAEAGHQIYHYRNFELAKQLQSEFKEKGIKSPPFVKLHSVIFCDEINLYFDNRDYKSFSPAMQRYFRLQRHYKHIFIGFSQTYDCDKKIRDLADYLIILRRFARIFVLSKSYYKKTVVVSPADENSREVASMTDDFVPMGAFYDYTSPFRAFLPYWVKQHDSYK